MNAVGTAQDNDLGDKIRVYSKVLYITNLTMNFVSRFIYDKFYRGITYEEPELQ